MIFSFGMKKKNIQQHKFASSSCIIEVKIDGNHSHNFKLRLMSYGNNNGIDRHSLMEYI